MPTLKEVLADKVGYQDNLAWTLGNGVTVTLGQLRGLGAEDQAAITKREKDIEASQAKIAASEAELKKAQLNTANLYTMLNTAQEAIKAGRYDDPSLKQLFGASPVPGGGNTTANDPFAALARLEQDTLLGPMVNVIKLVREEALKAQAAVAENVKTQTAMATNYLNGVLEDRYDRVVPADKQEKFPLATLIQNAVSNRLFTSDSVPDIKRAYKVATSGDDAAAREATIRAEERAKVLAEVGGRGPDGNQIFVPQPQNFGLDVHNRTGAAAKPFTSLDAAFDAAAKDPDIWKNVDQQTH